MFATAPIENQDSTSLKEVICNLLLRPCRGVLDCPVRGANAVAEAMRYGKGFHALDDDTIRRFVGTRWASGKGYSEAIWGYSERVAA